MRRCCGGDGHDITVRPDCEIEGLGLAMDVVGRADRLRLTCSVPLDIHLCFDMAGPSMVVPAPSGKCGGF
jgi:hypothetical protein